MADGNALNPGNPIAALYPQPSTNALSDPSRTIGLANALTQTQMLQQGYAAKQAQANALQQSIGDNGFDSAAYAQAIKGDPTAAYGMDPSDLLKQQGLTYENALKHLSVLGTQNDQAQQALASLSTDPNATKDTFRNQLTTLVRNGIVSPAIAANALGGLSDDPKKFAQQKTDMAARVMGPAAAASRVSGPVTPGGAQTTVPLAQSAMAGPYATGNAPGTEQGAGQMQADLARAGTYASDIFPWQQALEKVKALGPGGTGPGTAGRQQIESFLYSLNPTVARWAGVDPSKIASYDEFAKYATQGAQRAAAGFGSGTDSQLAASLSGNPNAHISDLANIDVLKASIGLKRMETAQALDAAQHGPVSYPYLKASWATQQDPRAFVLDQMSPDQVQKLQASLKGGERARFNASVASAVRNGFYSIPGQANGSGQQ